MLLMLSGITLIDLATYHQKIAEIKNTTNNIY
jgi:hypothetical protein